MSYLRIGEGLVDPVDRPAGHARVVQDADPRTTRLLPGDRHQDVRQLVPILGSRLGGGESRISLKIRALDGVTEPAVDLVAGRGDVDMAVLRLEDPGGNPRGMVVPRLGWNLP